MKSRTIAIPVEEAHDLGSRVASSFGDGKYYLIVRVDGNEIRSTEVRPVPPKEPGLWDCAAKALLKTLDCDVVLSPLIGPRARTIFSEFDVETAISSEGIASEVLEEYLRDGPRKDTGSRRCPEAGRGMFTKAAHAGGVDKSAGSLVPPIYQSSTFVFETAAQGARRFAGEEGGYIYTRMGNPTVQSLEEAVAGLEGGYAGLATSSGMAASVAVFMAVLGKDRHMVGTDSVYGPTRVVVERDFKRFGVESDFVNTSDIDQVRAAMRPNTALVHIETPANPTIGLTDIAACAEIAHEHGALLMVDNTFMSPYLQRPFELGADIVMHSMTKFLNGHSDVVAGMIVAANAELHKSIKGTLIYHGGTIDPHQAYLVLRGLKTLPLRMEKSQANAKRVARLLEAHPKIVWVRYPGLKSHPQYELARKQMYGAGALMSFEVEGGLAAGQKFLESVRVPALAVSLGGIESLIQHPASMTHAAMTPESREMAGITDGLVRLSVGCEDCEDLEEDLEQALALT